MRIFVVRRVDKTVSRERRHAHGKYRREERKKERTAKRIGYLLAGSAVEGVPNERWWEAPITEGFKPRNTAETKKTRDGIRRVERNAPFGWMEAVVAPPAHSVPWGRSLRFVVFTPIASLVSSLRRGLVDRIPACPRRGHRKHVLESR